MSDRERAANIFDKIEAEAKGVQGIKNLVDECTLEMMIERRKEGLYDSGHHFCTEHKLGEYLAALYDELDSCKRQPYRDRNPADTARRERDTLLAIARVLETLLPELEW